MADDVVEEAVGGVDPGQVQSPKLDVGHPEFLQRRLPLGNLAGREVHSEERGVWQRLGYGQQVNSVGAADLENPTMHDRGRLHPVQHGHRGHLVRVGHRDEVPR